MSQGFQPRLRCPGAGADAHLGGMAGVFCTRRAGTCLVLRDTDVAGIYWLVTACAHPAGVGRALMTAVLRLAPRVADGTVRHRGQRTAVRLAGFRARRGSPTGGSGRPGSGRRGTEAPGRVRRRELRVPASRVGPERLSSCRDGAVPHPWPVAPGFWEPIPRWLRTGHGAIVDGSHQWRI